jgi:hypothetical protein
MGDIVLFATRSPQNEQSNAVQHSEALKPLLLIGRPRVLTRQKITVEEFFKVGKIDVAVPDVLFALGIVLSVSFFKLYMQTAYASTLPVAHFLLLGNAPE